MREAGLLTIGAFSRLSRLSPKALRLYDELELLRPALVDPGTGYRLYDPDQLERAQLVAWLRRLGMPLAQIRTVCELTPAAAATEVSAFWARAESETAARRTLATFLIDHLNGKDSIVAHHQQPWGIRYAALSDIGLIRDANQDAAYAGSRLLAVADGFGGGGAPASTAAIEALKYLDAETHIQTGDLLNALQDAAEQAHQAVHAIAGNGPTMHGTGTTLTAMLLTGSQLALVHIGDSRAYLWRDAELFQITQDHTLVQSMVDAGSITPDEAASHPQRALLARAMAAGTTFAPDLHVQEVQLGDRYLLCSDGLSAVVPMQEVREVIATTPEPGEAVRSLVAMANRAGGPDNVSCVVAEVIELSAQ